MIGQVQPAPTPATQPPELSTDAPVQDVGTMAQEPVREIGGREGPDPTRYGDWEKNGRCIDF